MRYRATWTATLMGDFEITAPSRLTAFMLAENQVKSGLRIAPLLGGVVGSYDVVSLESGDEEKPSPVEGDNAIPQADGGDRPHWRDALHDREICRSQSEDATASLQQFPDEHSR